MKKFLLLFLILFVSVFTFGNFAKAEISVKDYMSYEFLDTQGYSTDMLRLIEINKAKTFGEPLPAQFPQKNPLARAYKKTMAYIDPAEDQGDFGFHNIRIQHSIWDY